MPVGPFRSCTLLLAGVLIGGLACRADHPSVVRIGDAIPRLYKQNNLPDVVRASIDTAQRPRIEIVPWSVSGRDNGIGEDAQARVFIADSSVAAVVGHAGSRITLMVEPLYRAGGMPMIVPTATARALRTRGPHVFMLAPTDDLIGAFLVDEATNRLGAKRLGIVYIADPYGDGIHEGVQARLRSRGDTLAGSAAMSGLECEGDALASDAVVHALLQRSRPDAVIVALPQKATWCVVRALIREAPSLTVLTTDSFMLVDEWPLTAAERANMYSLQFWEPGTDAASQAFVTQFRAVTKRDPRPSEALEVDAYQLVVAAAHAGNTTRQGVMTWLRQLGTPGHPPFQGLSGPIEFTRPRTSVLRLKALRAPSTPP